jgi:hypothetical protein
MSPSRGLRTESFDEIGGRNESEDEILDVEMISDELPDSGYVHGFWQA